MDVDHFHEGFQEVSQPVVADGAQDREGGRNANPAKRNRKERDQDQRHRHAARAFGRVVRGFRATPVEEGKRHLPHGVEGCAEGGDRQGQEDQAVLLEGHRQDLVLGPEPGRDDREAGQGQAADDEGPAGDRHLAQQAAHVAHVLRIVRIQAAVRPLDQFRCVFIRVGVMAVGVLVTMLHAVDNAAGAEKQQGLEKGMCQQMEQGGHVGSDAQGGHHVAKLRDGRIGQDPLHIPLRHCNRRRKECREGPDPCHQVRRCRGQSQGPVEQRVHANQQEHAGRDHGGRVDHGGHRGRTLHGVRQPDMQGELGALANGAAQDQEGDDGHPGHLAEAQVGVGAAQLVEIVLAEQVRKAEAARLADDVEHHHADEQQGVADAGGDKGLEGRLLGALLFEPEANQQVAAQAHDFPEDEEGNQVVGGHQPQHAHGKQRDIGHEAAVAGILALRMGLGEVRGLQVVREGHVAPGVDEDHDQQERHHEQHQRVRGIQRVPDVDVGQAGRNAEQRGVDRIFRQAVIHKGREGHSPADDQADDHAGNRDHRTEGLVAVRDENDQGAGHGRRQGHEPGQVKDRVHGLVLPDGG